MSKKIMFINFIENLLKETNTQIPEDLQSYWDIFRENGDKEKPMFTENGKLVLKYMQDNSNIELLKAKDIAEGLFISSRTVSGAMRKLVSDGFVEKVATDPVVYTITEKGKTIEII